MSYEKFAKMSGYLEKRGKMRTKNKERQQQWFYALISVLPQNAYQSPIFNTFSIIPLESKKPKSKRKTLSLISKSRKKHLSTDYFSVRCCNLEIAAETCEKSQTFSTSSSENTEKPFVDDTQSDQLIGLNSNSVSTLRPPVKHSSEVNIRKVSSYRSVITNASLICDETNLNRRSLSCECIFTNYSMVLSESYEMRGKRDSYSSTVDTEEALHMNFQQTDTTGSVKDRAKKSKRSFSFLKKLMSKRKAKEKLGEFETKADLDKNQQIEENEPRTIESNSYHSLPETIPEDSNVGTLVQESVEEHPRNSNSISELEIVADDDFEYENDEIYVLAEENKEEIPPIIPQIEHFIPELPLKKNRSSFAEEEFVLRSNEDSKKRDHISVNTIPELDLLLMELSVLNKSETEKGTESLQFNNTVFDEPDYDTPRPHRSLFESIPETDPDSKHTSSSGSVINERYIDSLSADIAPDSLEMPWLLNNTTCTVNYWTSKNDLCLSLESSSDDSESEVEFHDSLNSPSLIRSKKFCVEKNV